MSINPQDIQVLLAEDSAMMRKMEMKILQDLGFENILEAEDGNAAIARLQEGEKVDLIISDWNMPDKDGFELLVWVRASGEHATIPFIMATGQGDKGQEQKALTAGVSSFVGKPFNADELKAKIDEAFGMKPQEEETAGQREIEVTSSGKAVLKVAHIQITDHLVLGVLKHQIEKGELKPGHFELETQCMAGWNPVQQALEKGTVDAACILAPIAMDLFNFGAPIKLVLLAHKSGSIAVRSQEGEYRKPYRDFFKNRSFLIPHKMSVHHMLAHMFFNNMGLKGDMTGEDSDINFEVVPPIKMNDFLRSNSDVGGFMVAEPLGTKAISTGIAELQFLSSELWENHPCCVVVVRDDFIEAHPDAVHELTQMLVTCGGLIEAKPDTAAEIAVAFLDPERKLGLKVPVLRNVLTEEEGIKTGDLFPNVADLDRMQKYMTNKMGVGSLIDLDRFVDTQFAEAACKGMRTTSVLHDAPAATQELLERREGGGEIAAKAMLNLAGKYLTFSLKDQGFGIEIVKIREIIGLMPITPVPSTFSFIKGVFNLRGSVVPAVDLRIKLGMKETDPTDRTCIIVLEHESRDGKTHTGFIVDSVTEVQEIQANEIESTPSFGATVDTRYILAMAKVATSDKVNVLLDVDHLLNDKTEVAPEAEPAWSATSPRTALRA